MYCSFSVAQQPNLGLGRLVVEVYRSHTDTRTHTPGRTSLNDWSARRRGRYLHNTQRTQERFEPVILAIERAQTYALDRGICIFSITPVYLVVEVYRSHTDTRTHTPGRTSLNEWSARRRGRYLHNTQRTQETNIRALREIRTRDLSDRAGADLRLRPRDLHI